MGKEREKRDRDRGHMDTSRKRVDELSLFIRMHRVENGMQSVEYLKLPK